LGKAFIGEFGRFLPIFYRIALGESGAANAQYQHCDTQDQNRPGKRYHILIRYGLDIDRQHARQCSGMTRRGVKTK
jgi:hypothetical protein